MGIGLVQRHWDAAFGFQWEMQIFIRDEGYAIDMIWVYEMDIKLPIQDIYRHVV